MRFAWHCHLLLKDAYAPPAERGFLDVFGFLLTEDGALPSRDKINSWQLARLERDRRQRQARLMEDDGVILRFPPNATIRLKPCGWKDPTHARSAHHRTVWL
jgi:hypothetical protein